MTELSALPEADRAQSESRVRFQWAKRLFFWALVLRLLVLLLGLLGTFVTGAWSLQLVVALFFFSLVAEGLGLSSDHQKGEAEGLLRKVDFWKGFGWVMSSAERRRLGAREPRLQETTLYFASEAPLSARRAMENLVEQAWWSAELHRWMGNLVVGGVIALVLLTLMFILMVLAQVSSAGSPFQTVKLASGLLNLAFSLGLLKLYFGYQRMQRAAEAAEAAAERLLKQSDIDALEALRLYANYHVARASAPLIPDAIYHIRQEELNQRWKAEHG
ncbi:hypothetical protein MF271_21675 (plasmid) [Deinococcus sp. KNUC1210]|uniref:hypothetical protein n=1 Tax=Deinococcus sp. KNUC1210 TaxID=2917691 RepID=UPI001EEFB3F5|nr:hypothetical protein [Deinococcus sp. KNUC1210]ULH17812.1 hypothetical protein MF271_21675 [Deinococcus sp. KNUC1210]